MVLQKQLLVHFEVSRVTVVVSPGTNLLGAASKAGISLRSTCGGQGECGECRLMVLDGLVSPPTSDEISAISESDRFSGIRLACTTRVYSSVTIRA